MLEKLIMKSSSNFLVFIAIFIVMISFLQSNFWHALFFISISALLLFTTNLIFFLPKVFPFGIRGKINNFELEKLSKISAAFLSFFIFSSYICHFFYTKSFGNHISISLGFLAGSIAWAIISLVRKLFLKAAKISIFQNIFAICILIIVFKGVNDSAQSQVLKGDLRPDMPSYFNMALIFWQPLMKNFKALFLYKRASIKTKAKIIELSIWSIIVISMSILITFGMYKSGLVVSAIAAIYLLSLPYLKTVFPKIATKAN